MAAVPEDIHKGLLIDGTDVQTKVGHVANFDEDQNKNDLEQNLILDDLVHFKKSKNNNQFIGLTKEELKLYINNPKWKRIRWIIGILYILLVLLLLIGAILFIIFSSRCPPKAKLVWYQKEIIYEIDVTTFKDSNDDGIGDIKGIEEKINYFEKNNIKSILLRSSIFNITSGTSIKLDGVIIKDGKFDLLTIDPLIGNETNLLNLAKILNRKDMHLIIDLPLSSTSDPNGLSWYGSNNQLQNKIDNPCNVNPSDLGCLYYKLYGRLPLDFNNQMVSKQAESRIDYWLSQKKLDGIRVNLPLNYNPLTRSYNISFNTIEKWNKIINDIEKKTKPKLFLIDIPFGLENVISNDDLHNKTTHPLLLLNENKINSQILDQRFKSFKINNLSKPLFWQLGSERRSDQIGIINQNQLTKEIVLTLTMLVGGTPIILYGEEIGLDQRVNPLMAWTNDQLYGGFSSCSSFECKQILSSYKIDLSKTNVKRQEALGGEKKDSLLNIFRYLTKLRQEESFQFGLLESGYHEQTNTFWFIREAPGYKGYIVLFNLNKDDKSHISLYEITKHDVPLNIHYEYQWPNSYFIKSNETHINSDNLFIHPESINIFWWKPKLIKPNILFKNAKEHEDIH